MSTHTPPDDRSVPSSVSGGGDRTPADEISAAFSSDGSARDEAAVATPDAMRPREGSPAAAVGAGRRRGGWPSPGVEPGVDERAGSGPPFDLPVDAGRSGGQPVPGEATRGSLLRAGLDLFGRKGFDATSTRDIARAAGVNIAGIAYHFGGKTGLHRACAGLIGRTIEALFAVTEPADAPADAELDPDAALERFVEVGSTFARFLLARPEAEAIARFMVREQMDPSPTFDIIYEGLIRPRHRRMCRLWGRAVGEAATSEAVVIAVSTIIGQIVFFRVGRATALRVLDWQTIDGDRVERILAVVRETIRAMAAAQRARRTAP